jgi:antitoxin component of RelBE/YafQ-DinJ toxin-antitoxin module
VTIRLDGATVEYFKAMAEETGVRYQTLINLYLRECAASGKRLALAWVSGDESSASVPVVANVERQPPVAARSRAKRSAAR